MSTITMFQRVDAERRIGVDGAYREIQKKIKAGSLTYDTSYAVRRPMRGIVIPKDAPATIEIVNPSGDPPDKVLRNSSVPPDVGVNYTANFIIQSFTESRSEKHQFISTFGATYAFFFGEQPRQVSVTAVVPNSADFEWHREWWLNYEEHLRGTSLASSNTKVKLRVAEGRSVTAIKGYILNCSSSISAQDPYAVQISFSMFVESIDRWSYAGPLAPSTIYGPNVEDIQNLAGQSPYESSTAAVRRANIKLSPLTPGPGSINKFLGRLSAVDAAVDNFVRTARNLLYGRNLVVPVSYTSTKPRGSLFASGSDESALNNLTLTNFAGVPTLAFSNSPGTRPVRTVDLRTTAAGALAQDARYRDLQQNTRFYYQNFDEYLSYPETGLLTKDFQFEATIRDLTTEAEAAYYQNQSIAAFASFGIEVTPLAAVPGISSRRELEAAGAVAYTAQAKREAIANVFRVFARAAFAGVTFMIGRSVVNSRRELQESIVNPNSGNLDSQVLLSAQADISRTNLSSEQRRLAASKKAERLRGETGTITPGTISAILSVIL